MNANRGYVGWSRSQGAATAEREGKLPLTRAVKAVAEMAGCTQKKAREVLKEIGPCEWHHTSKHFNETDYYSVAGACLKLDAESTIAGLPADWEDSLRKSGPGKLASLYWHRLKLPL